MNKIYRFLAAVALGLFFVGVAAADTLELKDGRVLKGKYLGGTQAVLRFEVSGEVQAFNTNDIVALTFTGHSGTAAAALAPAAASSAANTSAGGDVTIPAGETLLVRMIDGVDSAKNHVGDVFHASLETDLTIGNTVVARKGTDVYGRLAEAKEAKKVGGGAVAGAIIGAIAGGGKGAAIGAGVGSAAGAGVQVLTKGQQVKVPSETLLEFRLQQPATVTPTQK